ncbi:MAG: hypothetical protein JST67_08865 [Bacteroidetes bacterium]|nr:hypothetical protein [Bacteroidota bacterium]
MKTLFFTLSFIFAIGRINAQIVQQKTGTYRLVVSFTSKGAGIDSKSFDEISALAQNYRPKINYETCQMGREGERNLLFKLNEISKKKQRKFVKEVKTKIKDTSLVFVKEDTNFDSPCRSIK